jgi:hypothetical protein
MRPSHGGAVLAKVIGGAPNECYTQNSFDHDRGHRHRFA